MPFLSYWRDSGDGIKRHVIEDSCCLQIALSVR